MPARSSAASTSGWSSAGGSLDGSPPAPGPGPSSRASRTSRPSARPSSSSALQGSIVRSIATDCDSRGDGHSPASTARTGATTEIRWGRSGWRRRRRGAGRERAPSTIRSTPRSGSRPSATESVSVCLPARECAGTVGRDRGRARELREAGAIDEIVVVDAASADGTAEAAERAGRRGAPGGGADGRVRPGARQGRRDVARAVGARGGARLLPGRGHARVLGPLRDRPARAARVRARGGVREGVLPPPVRAGRGVAAGGRGAREPPDGAPGARAVLPGAGARCASRSRARSRRGGSCSSACRSRPATAWRSRC